MKKRAVVFLLSAIIAATTFAVQLPRPDGFVNDYCNILSPQQNKSLEDQLSLFEKETKIEISVAVVKSLEGEEVEEYAVDLFKSWGIGKKNSDNGVLLLVAPNERKMRIEVGYGLEQKLTDAYASRIIREQITPKFKEGRMDAGIILGTKAIIGVVRGEKMQISNQDSDVSFFDKLVSSRTFWIVVVIIGILIIVVFVAAFGDGYSGGGSSGGSYYGGGFFSGGSSGSSGGGGSFGGFGGGSSGGGGASGSW